MRSGNIGGTCGQSFQAIAAGSSTSEFICKDGRKIRVGDCALFEPSQDSPPFIGIICKLTLKEESPSVGVNWLYRPVDVKLDKGILLEAAPNEVFYSFDKDEIPAALLLHPCKVAFLCKGVELPSGISAFVCRRVYDIEKKCLRWLTDKDYMNEQQEEIDQLLDKTRVEMHGVVQPGGHSPKPLNNATSTPSLKSASDNVQNSSSFGSQGKGKKRERVDQGSDSSKREQLTKTEDGDSPQFRPESILKSEISKITDKGGLVDFEGVEKLVQLMQPDSVDKKIDLAGRIMLVDVLAMTDRFDCLGWFVQLRGLPVLDDWLQEFHKGKIGDGNAPKESDKSIEEFLLALLRALDKLPVNLHALQTCNVGKSVNHLRTHKNSEIQKKARSLVDTWKRRVEAEMNMNDAKSGWPAKPASSEVSHIGSRKTGGSVEIAAKNSTIQPLVSKNSQPKFSSGEALSKSFPSPGSSKSVIVSVGCDQHFKTSVGSGTSDIPLIPIKEERSSSSSQSQNNSLSCKEDARSSTAISLSASKIPGNSSRHRKSSNGLHGSGVNAIQKEPSSGKNSGRNSPSGKVSPTQASDEKLSETPSNDQGNNWRPIVRLPNTGCSPARGASGSISSINALVESCVKFSEVNASISPRDDVGMNLLATVAAGEISRSENTSPMASPERKSPMADELCSGNDRKSKHSDEAIACCVGQSDTGAAREHVDIADPGQLKNDTKHPVTPMSCDMSRDGDATSSSCVEKTDDGRTHLNSSFVDLLQNGECPSLTPETKEDASQTIFSSKKEILAETEGVHQVLKARASTEKDTALVSEASNASVKIEKEANKKLLESSSGVDNEHQVRVGKVTGTGISVQKSSTVSENFETKEGADKDAVLPAASGDGVMESKPENAVDKKPREVEQNKRQMDLVSSMSAGVNECVEGNSDRKDFLGHCSGLPVQSELLKIPMQENEVQKKTSGCNLDQDESEGAGDQHGSNVNASDAVGLDTDVKLDFDLNVEFPVDDVNQAGIVKQEEPIASFAVHMPCPLPFPLSSMSASFHPSITVASAAKGPVVLLENPLQSKGELGWKGSAATSAFQPAKRRKSVEQPSNTSEMPSAAIIATKQGRPPLDFDLNVPDQRSFDDVASHGTWNSCLESGPHDCGIAGLDLDLNRVDETLDAGSFSINKLDIHSLPNKPSYSGGLFSGGSVSRDFDLNDGPGLDEVGPEAPICSQQIKSTVPFPLAVHGVRPSNAEFGNYSGNSYSAITIPPLFPGRGDQNFVAGAGAHRILGSPGSISFVPEIYRGPVLQSSPAVAYPPTMPFQYPGFPFETNFPLPSNSFSGSSTPFMDSSSAGGHCLPTMPPQLVGPGGIVPSTYTQPFVMSLPGGTSNVLPKSIKWGSQSLDLNFGPGGADSERRDDRLPSVLRPLSTPNSQALTEEQMKMFHVTGSVLKRKEPDAGWDGADRFSYKQPSWQ